MILPRAPLPLAAMSDVVHATLADIRPLDLYLGEDLEIAKTDVASQAEFAKPIWEYVASAVTFDRKTRGSLTGSANSSRNL